jgi:hypothetical protein
MMNGSGKSDSPAVPGKSPNKAGPPVAEGMEGNGLAKGNLPEQNAPRTPSRYVKQQSRIGSCGSRRSGTTSITSKHCAWPTSL